MSSMQDKCKGSTNKHTNNKTAERQREKKKNFKAAREKEITSQAQ